MAKRRVHSQPVVTLDRYHAEPMPAALERATALAAGIGSRGYDGLVAGWRIAEEVGLVPRLTDYYLQDDGTLASPLMADIAAELLWIRVLHTPNSKDEPLHALYQLGCLLRHIPPDQLVAVAASLACPQEFSRPRREELEGVWQNLRSRVIHAVHGSASPTAAG